MALNPVTVTEKRRQLDELAAQQMATGVTAPLTGPAVDDGSFQVAAGGPRNELAKLVGRLLGGGSDNTPGSLNNARTRAIEGETTPPATAAPRYLGGEGRVYDEPPPGVGVELPAARPDAEETVLSDAPPQPAAAQPLPTLSPEALEKRVLQQQQGVIRPSEVEADEVLSATLEPRSTALVSDGLTDFRVVGAAGDAKIPDEGNVLAIIEQTSRTYEMQVDQATRGKIRHEVSQELADYIGTNPEQLMAAVMNMKSTGGVPIVEGAGISETILAVRNLLYSEVAKLDALAEAATSSKGSAEDLLNFRQQLEVVSNLQANFKGVQTEIGRSMGIFRVPVDHSNASMREVNLANMVDQFGGEQSIRDLASAYLALPVGGKRAQFTKVSRFKKFTNAAYEVWINNLLLGPITHTKNFVAAGMTVFAEIPLQYAAAAYGSARRAMGGEGGQTFGEVRAMAFGQMMALREAFALAGHSYRTGEVPITGSKLGDALDAGSRRVSAFSAEGFEMNRNTAASSFFAAAVDGIGSFLTAGRVSTRSLGFEDTFWKVVAQRGNLWQQAFRGADEQGLKGDAAAEFMANFIRNPPAAAMKEADDLARKLTLQQPLESRLGKVVQGAARVGFMRWFIPFVKTPYNAFTLAFEHTPFAPLTKNYKDAIASGNQSRIDVARTRVALGSAAGVVIGTMAASGEITGGGPKDPGLRAALVRQGWQPYSKRIGDQYYSYAGAEPYSTIVGIIADAVELVQTGLVDQDEADELLVAVVFALGQNLSNKTFMEGFSNFMNAVTNGERYAEKTVESFARSVVPLVGSGASRQIAKQIDTYRRDPVEYESLPDDFDDLPTEQQQKFSAVLARYPTYAWLRNRIGELQANVPGWSKTVPALRDFWGRKVANQGAYGPDILSPIYMSIADTTDTVIDGKTYDTGVLDREMIRLKLSEKEHPADYAGFPLNAAERDFFQDRAGVHSVLLMTRVFESSGYQRLREQGVNQKPQAEVNESLRGELRKAIVGARKIALQELRQDETLGQDFRESERQMAGLEKAMTKKSYRGDQQ